MITKAAGTKEVCVFDPTNVTLRMLATVLKKLTSDAIVPLIFGSTCVTSTVAGGITWADPKEKTEIPAHNIRGLVGYQSDMLSKTTPPIYTNTRPMMTNVSRVQYFKRIWHENKPMI